MLGRDPNNDIVIDTDVVSRQHARLERRDSGYEIIDLGSTTGTLVNGRPVHQQRLRDGDVIRIGEAEIVFRAGSAVPPASPEEAEAEPATHAGQPRRAVVSCQAWAARSSTAGARSSRPTPSPWLGT